MPTAFPGCSFRLLLLKTADPHTGFLRAWYGLAEALPPDAPTASEIAAILGRYRIAEATVLLSALVQLAADRLARVGALEGEIIVHPGGADVRPRPIRLGIRAFGLADAREGWSALLEARHALGLDRDKGITSLPGRHMPLVPRLLSAYVRLALRRSLGLCS